MKQEEESRIKILYISPIFPPFDKSFIQQDLALLRKHFQVNTYEYKGNKNAGKNLIVWLIKNKKMYDIIYIVFGDVYATLAVFVAKLLRKKSIIFVGGYDTTYIPEYNYGFLSSPKKRLFALCHFHFADKVLTVDESLKDNIIKNLNVRGNNIMTVPTGYDSDFWAPDPILIKEELAITVGVADSISRANIKGIDRVINIARKFPDNDFIVVGVTGDALIQLKKDSPANLVFIPTISSIELLKYYQKSKIYLQLSITEGLPNTLCESMLCECIPVGTKVGGIPTAIGQAGFYINYNSIDDTVNTIKSAFLSDLGKTARNRIIKMFPIEKRESELISIVRKLALNTNQ